MALEQRRGTFGLYYGNTYNSSQALNQSQMEQNAKYLYSALSNIGFTLNSISAMLGNMQTESSINPGRWQSDIVGNLEDGYGLVQWTPASKYINWAKPGDPSDIDLQVRRINYEVENGIQWIATSSYPLSFEEFKVSKESPYYLAMAFITNYERPADPSQPWRGEQAEKWYTFLSGEIPNPPTPTTKKKKRGYNFLLYKNRSRHF